MKRARKAPAGRRPGQPEDEDTPATGGGLQMVFPDCLGPMPLAALACLIDLGMTDAEIAAYFGLGVSVVVTLTGKLRDTLRTQRILPPRGF